MNTLRGWTRPRPIRVAFLVEDGEQAALMLDGVFADCYARWGGRFSLIVPCVDKHISAAYWPWLESYDPDLIYSYVALSEAETLEIHERLGPAEIYFYRPVGEPRLNVQGFKPDYRFAPLSSISTSFRLARYRRGGGLPLRLIDSWSTEKPSRFLTDNFGTYGQSTGTGLFPVDAMAAIDRLVIVSPDKAADRKFGIPQDLTTVGDELEGMRAFADGRATSMAILSAQFAPKQDIHFGRWSGTFNLVVGDTFADRLLHWNARLLIPTWLDTNLCCFRATADQLENADFLAALVVLLNRDNHVNGGTGGQPQLVLRSCSLDVQQLAPLATRLKAARVWSGVSSEVVASPDAVIPDTQALAAAREGNRFTGDHFPIAGWTKFEWSLPTARPPADAPDHLAEAPVRQSFTTGLWASDFILEHEGPGLRFGENHWSLPRRWRMARAFKIDRVSDQPHSLVPAPRASREGRLVAFVDVDHPIATIKVPTVRDALGYALAVDGLHAKVARDSGEIILPAKVEWLEPSNENRYLTGVVGMAEGLGSATSFLLHPFLRDIFTKLGGFPNPTDHDVERTDNRLKKLMGRQQPFDVRDVGDRQALSNLIVRAARDLKYPNASVRYEDLKDRWQAHRTAFWAHQHPQHHQTPEENAEWEEREARSLETCLTAMRRRQMLFQGHRWTCRRCSHHNWQDFGDLSPELICAVCKQTRQAPIAIDWQFRPNEFLIECLRDHSTLSLIWVLHSLEQRARSSFLYVGPTAFGFTPDAQRSEGEGDLMIVADGKTILCEAKSSWRDVRAAEVEKLAELALRLRPDFALLAVMETGGGPTAKIAETRARLAAAGITLEVMTPQPDDVFDDPYLPSDE